MTSSENASSDEYLGYYGWLTLGASIVLLFLWSKIKPYINKWQKEKEEREYAAKYHKDPDLLLRRQEAVERARLKLAEQYEADAKRAAERMKEKEEKKRQEWLLRNGGIGHPGNRLNEDINNGPSPSDANDVDSNKKKPARMKEDYNPLMGDHSRNYRPGRRSACCARPST